MKIGKMEIGFKTGRCKKTIVMKQLNKKMKLLLILGLLGLSGLAIYLLV